MGWMEFVVLVVPIVQKAEVMLERKKKCNLRLNLVIQSKTKHLLKTTFLALLLFFLSQ